MCSLLLEVLIAGNQLCEQLLAIQAIGDAALPRINRARLGIALENFAIIVANHVPPELGTVQKAVDNITTRHSTVERAGPAGNLICRRLTIEEVVVKARCQVRR